MARLLLIILALVVLVAFIEGRTIPEKLIKKWINYKVSSKLLQKSSSALEKIGNSVGILNIAPAVVSGALGLGALVLAPVGA